ncbi:MAG: hypothetical protein HY216_17520 [Candidatus Rokubacteria bacterium]|nr:hypothetical protein [Candidatus Rokubacteria bacterium]
MRLTRRQFLAGAAAVIAAPYPGEGSEGPPLRSSTAGAPLAAHETGGAPREIPRRVLALYKSFETYRAVEGARPKTATLNEIHQWAQMPLNWLGLMVDYHDVARGLPDETTMARYAGVVTWYQTDEMDEPLRYARWLGAQAAAGRRVVILGTLGALRERGRTTPVPLAALSAALRPLPLTFKGDVTADPSLIVVRAKDAIMEFERTLPPALPNYLHVTAGGAETHLRLARRDRPDSDSDVVVTGAWGGFAADNYVRFQASVPYARPADAATGVDTTTTGAQGVTVSRWWIDPFAFFERALGVADWPRADVTTLNGRRLLYCHVDGDGMRNVSEVRRGAFSGEVLLDEILKRYRLPMTVSVVAAEVDPALLGSARTLGLARAIFALPHVEAASHSFSHPLDWERRTRSFDLPGHPYSVETETAGSIRYIEGTLLPPGKRVRVFQWSGSTNVSESALAALARLNVPNINGGDTMYDRQWPTYTRVAPLMRQVGRYWQVYTSASNENLYTNLWRGPFYGFRYVRETFRNTGAPRRVAPVNIYYHFYSAERAAALHALSEVYDWARAERLAPVYTSEYLAMVDGFRTARLARTGDGWRVFDHGALRTVRFDGAAAARGIDLARSRGVLGFARHEGALYVHLAGPGDALIVPGAGRAADQGRDGPYLASASHAVSDWRREGGRLVFRLAGVGPKSVDVGGLPPGRDVTLQLTDARGPRTVTARAAADGVVSVAAGDADPVSLDAQGASTVFVEVQLG